MTRPAAPVTVAPSTRPRIPVQRFGERLERAQAGLARTGLGALLVAVGPDLVYLAGYDAMPLERLTMLVVPASGRAILLVPRLEAAPARACPGAAGGHLDVLTWEETDDPVDRVASLVRGPDGAPSPGRASGGRVGVSDRLWALHVLRLQRALPGVDFGSASVVLRDLRMVKDADEIELLRLAARAADRRRGPARSWGPAAIPRGG